MRLKIVALAMGICLALGAVPAMAAGVWLPAGPEVPFPLSAQLPFPWGTIEGIWEAKSDKIDTLYSFEVQNDCDNRKILKVIELDPATGAVVAEGMGIAVDDKRIVRAAMSSEQYGSYMLFIRAFKDTKSARTPKVATVLTVRPFSGTENDDAHVVVRKVTAVPFRASKANQYTPF